MVLNALERPRDEVAIWVTVLPAPPMRSWLLVIDERPVPPEIAARALVKLSVPMVDEAAVVVAKVEVPVNVDVPVTPRLLTKKRVPSKVTLAESINRPPVVINGTRPLVRDETAS